MKIAAALLTLISMNAMAAAPSCPSLFTPKQGESVAAASLRAQTRRDYKSPNVEAYEALRAVMKAHPEFKSGLVRSLVAVLRDEQLSTYHVRAKIVLDAVAANPSIDSAVTALQADLVKRMPESMATERSELLRSETLTKEMMMRALGGMNAEESLKALIGDGAPGTVAPDSLVGRYLARAGKPVSTLFDSFKQGPGYKGRGGEKLYIAVDAETAQLADELFGKNPQLLIHNHDTGQGTLHMHHDGKSISYSQYDFEGTLDHEPGKMAPLLALSSIEASNVKNYFDLGKIDSKFAKYPWSYRQSRNSKDPSYCKVGGYLSCTHWIGEMAFGEKFVEQYRVPKFTGDDPYGQRPPGMEDGDVIARDVGTYNSFKVPDERAIKIGSTSRRDRLVRMVWTQKLGREQLWSVVGDKDAAALNAGEWANPGWVLYSFMTRTSYDRVPVVLVFVDDASAKLTRRKVAAFRQHITLH